MLDPVIHAQARLRIMATLAALAKGDELSFPRLRSTLDMTAGNLSTHLSKLEGAGYVRINKTFRGRTPATYLSPHFTSQRARVTRVRRFSFF